MRIPKKGEIWLDSTGTHRNRAVRITDTSPGFVCFEIIETGVKNEWLLEDFIKDAVCSEVSRIKQILSRYE